MMAPESPPGLGLGPRTSDSATHPHAHASTAVREAPVGRHDSDHEQVRYRNIVDCHHHDDHHHNDDYHHNEHHHHEAADEHAQSLHNHGSEPCCTSAGWGQFMPHAHGLTSRLAGDRRALTLSLVVVLCTCLIQLVAGVIAWASVLVTEAVHSALDGLSVALSLVAVVYASRSPTPRMTYGYARAETLAAVVSVLMLALLCVKLFLGALHRLWHIARGTGSQFHVQGKLVFAAEAVTLMSNILMAFALTKLGGRSHGGHPDDNSVFRPNPEQMSLNLRALRAHILADSVENIVVLFAGMLMWLVPSASIIDPILTGVIVTLLMYLNAPIAKEVAHIVMQGAPTSIDVQYAASALARIPGVVSCGELHVWILTSDTHMATAIIYVGAFANVGILDSVRVEARSIFRKLGVAEATIEVVRVPPEVDNPSGSSGFDSAHEPLSAMKIDMDDLDEDIQVHAKLLLNTERRQ
jgi:cobalt-zinc-cadmium efflux system protein